MDILREYAGGRSLKLVLKGGRECGIYPFDGT
jgi:hypothetical protein